MNESISWILLFYILISMGCGEPTQEHKIEKLIQKLGVKDPSVRRISASELGSIGSTDVVPALIQALQDQDAKVRDSATDALEKIGKDAVPALIQALQNEDWNIRYFAIEVLERIGTPDALKAVEEYQSRQ